MFYNPVNFDKFEVVIGYYLQIDVRISIWLAHNGNP